MIRGLLTRLSDPHGTYVVTVNKSCTPAWRHNGLILYRNPWPFPESSNGTTQPMCQMVFPRYLSREHLHPVYTFKRNSI